MHATLIMKKQYWKKGGGIRHVSPFKPEDIQVNNKTKAHLTTLFRSTEQFMGCFHASF